MIWLLIYFAEVYLFKYEQFIYHDFRFTILDFRFQTKEYLKDKI